MGTDVFGAIGNAFESGGKTITHGISDGAKSVGNWFGDAANSATDTVGSAAKYGLDWTGNQISTITGVFSSPTFLIVAGVVIVGILILK